jgi:hypothetical protein
MALNIVAERKMSLDGFAEGWSKCYLVLRAVNEEKRMKWGELLRDETDDSVAVPKLQAAAAEVIIGGKVINTNEDGSTEEVSVALEDAPAVVNALGIFWLQEVLLVSSGADRLKALTTKN